MTAKLFSYPVSNVLTGVDAVIKTGMLNTTFAFSKYLQFINSINVIHMYYLYTHEFMFNLFRMLNFDHSNNFLIFLDPLVEFLDSDIDFLLEHLDMDDYNLSQILKHGAQLLILLLYLNLLLNLILYYKALVLHSVHLCDSIDYPGNLVLFPHLQPVDVHDYSLLMLLLNFLYNLKFYCLIIVLYSKQFHHIFL